MDKLVDLKVNKFVELLSSEEPAPGGGSASALYGALGVALCSMVAQLTVGRKKYEMEEERMRTVMDETKRLIDRMQLLIDKDTLAYTAVSEAMKLPRNTDSEKDQRTDAIQNALKEATIVPYAMMETAAEALRVMEKTLGHSNINAVSDIGVGALGLKAALQGAWLNVLINLGGIKDASFVEKHRQNGEAILMESIHLADRLYDSVAAQLRQ